MRPLLAAGFVLVVIVAGTLGLVGFSQDDAERRQAIQQQQGLATMAAAAAVSGTLSARMVAIQLADGATQQARDEVEAAQAKATLDASRARGATSVAVSLNNAHATSTAQASR